MTTRARCFPIIVCALAFTGMHTFAQSPERGAPSRAQQPPERAAAAQPSAGTLDPVAGEIALLRKALLALSSSLRAAGDRAARPGAESGDPLKEQQNRISLGLELLSRAEQRAAALRREFLEMVEKETALRTRTMQLDEEMRPDSIERATSLVGTVRTSELRDARRRLLENERKGLESLLGQTAQSRARLEDDVRQADSLVTRLRQRVLPLIDKEIEKINPD